MRTLALVLAMAVPASAQSLMGDGQRLLGDPPKKPAFKKHDLIQISAVENSRAQSQADLRTDRRSRPQFLVNQFAQFDFKDQKLLPTFHATDLGGQPGIDLDDRYRQDNSGTTSRTFNLTFMVTAEVIDVRPNGNLVIQAKKRRKVNSDEEVIKLTGEISPSMVVNNTVKSEQIANLDITYEGAGSVSDNTRPGWLGWLLGKLWPF